MVVCKWLIKWLNKIIKSKQVKSSTVELPVSDFMINLHLIWMLMLPHVFQTKPPTRLTGRRTGSTSSASVTRSTRNWKGESEWSAQETGSKTALYLLFFTFNCLKLCVKSVCMHVCVCVVHRLLYNSLYTKSTRLRNGRLSRH